MVRFGNAARGPGEFGRQWVKVRNNFFHGHVSFHYGTSLQFTTV